MVSRQPCSSARTVTMSSMQPEHDKHQNVCHIDLKSILLATSNNYVLFTYPRLKWISVSRLYQYSAAVACPAIDSQKHSLRWKWSVNSIKSFSLQQKKERKKLSYKCLIRAWRLLTAHSSKSKIPSDQTSVLGPEGRGASSWEESLEWKEPWAITSGARYDGYLRGRSQGR